MIKKFFVFIFKILSRAVLWLRRWTKLLQPARASFIASLLVPILFLGVGQGRDIVRQLVAETSYDPLTHEPVHLFRISWHVAWMYAGLFAAGLSSWAWARFLLGYEFPNTPDELKDIQLERAQLVRKYFRRICGWIPPLGMAGAFVFASIDSPHRPQCWLLTAGALLIVLILWVCFEYVRRQRLQQMKTQHESRHKLHRFHSLQEVKCNNKVRRSIYISWGVSLVLFVTLTAAPVKVGQFLGSSAVLLFAIATWITIGSAIIFAGDWHRVPALTIVFAWSCICSVSNDNHHVRTLPASHQVGTPMGLNSALKLWHEQVTNKYQLAPGQKHPLFLVAAAGGGIRAAYWTAVVLGDLEDCAQSNHTSFAEHTFALSGVSGGSLGEVGFVALKAHGTIAGEGYRKSAGKILDDDFLAADLAKMAFADLLQRVIPWPIQGFDRARSLENAWADSWKANIGTDNFNESLSELYTTGKVTNGLLPHLLLNGTCVETGQRIITSDLDIAGRIREHGRLLEAGEYLDAIAATSKLTNKPIRLSTAAHQSARFTYFSPAGRFTDGTHVVDGGYFENSGATTLIDTLTAIRNSIHTNGWKDVEPMLVLIDNEPIKLQPKTNYVWYLRESLSPVFALLNTRDARGNYAFQQALDIRKSGTNVFEFHLYQRPPCEALAHLDRPAELPLGWVLSRSAIEEMEAQLSHDFRVTDSMTISNTLTISQIVSLLPRQPGF